MMRFAARRFGLFSTRDGLAAVARRAGGFAAVVLLASCGWHPVYAPAGADQAAAGDGLAAIDVAVIHERSGQLLRQALQARLQHSSEAPPPIYELQAQYSESRDGVAIAPDSSVTRIRMIGTASYTVVSLTQASRTCLSGNARDVDGYDAQNEQFFASDLESETVQRRITEALADQIVSRIARAARAPGGLCG